MWFLSPWQTKHFRMRKIVPLLTIALNGAFIDLIILIAFVLVPYWKSCGPHVFLTGFLFMVQKMAT